MNANNTIKLTVNAFKYEFHVPVHVVQINNAPKVVVKRNVKFLDVYRPEEVALPVELRA